MKQKQRKAAKAAFGCLVLLLLYGCASHASGFYGGQADAEDDTAGADFSWTEAGLEHAMDAADGTDGAADGLASGETGMSGQTGRQPSDRSPAGAADGGTSESRAAGASPETIAVYVCGAVKAPGVYELAAGSRVYEAVAMAGGMTEEAAQRSVNQAGTLTDGQMIVILTEEEAEETGVEAGSGAKAAAEQEDGLVNINTAGAQELKTLPGIGDAKAAAIVAYREENGAFAAVSDIKKVSGIGDSVFARLEDFIKVD